MELETKEKSLYPTTNFNKSVWRDYKVPTNCLAFALGNPELGIAVPGKLLSPTDEERTPKEEITVDGITQKLIESGLKPISEHEAMDSGRHAIALRICFNHDYHFYRNIGGEWYHKEGINPPTNTGSNKEIIHNPRLTDGGIYEEFGGYFAVPEEGIPYIPKLEIR